MASKVSAPVGPEYQSYPNNFNFSFAPAAKAVGARTCFFSDDNVAYVEQGVSLTPAATSQVAPAHANMKLTGPNGTLIYLTRPLSQSYAKLVVTLTVNSYTAGTLQLSVQRFAADLQSSDIYASDIQNLPAGSPAVSNLTFEIPGQFNRGDVIAVQYQTDVDSYMPALAGTWQTVPVVKVYDSGDISTLANLASHPLAVYLANEITYAPGFSGTYVNFGTTTLEMVASLEANTWYVMRIFGPQAENHYYHVDTKQSNRADSGWGSELFFASDIDPTTGTFTPYESVIDVPFQTGPILGQSIMQLITSRAGYASTYFRRIQVFKMDTAPANANIANLVGGGIYDTGPIRTAADLSKRGWQGVDGQTGTTNADKGATGSGTEVNLHGVRVSPNTWYAFEITGINLDPPRRSYLNFLVSAYGGGFIANSAIIGVMPKVVDAGNDSVYKFWWNSGSGVHSHTNYMIGLHRDGGLAFTIRRIRMYSELPPA